MAKEKRDYNELIIAFIKEHPQCSSQEILSGLHLNISIATLKRALQKLVAQNLVSITGKLKSTIEMGFKVPRLNN